jgi:hypothetical protein
MGNATKLAAEEVCGKIAALARDGCSKVRRGLRLGDDLIAIHGVDGGAGQSQLDVLTGAPPNYFRSSDWSLGKRQLRRSIPDWSRIVSSDAAVGNNISPIYDLFGGEFPKVAQAGSNTCKPMRSGGIAGQSVRRVNFIRVGIDTPVGAHSRVVAGEFGFISNLVALDEPGDKVSATERPNLIVRYIKKSSKLTDPICLQCRVAPERRAPIANKYRQVSLDDWFHPMVIVHATIDWLHRKRT